MPLRAALTHRRHLMLLYLFLQTNLITRTIWIHPLNEDQYYKGEFYVLYPDLRNYPAKFFTMYRMSVSKFDELLELLMPALLRQNTNYQTSISPEQRLVLTLMLVCFPFGSIAMNTLVLQLYMF